MSGFLAQGDRVLWERVPLDHTACEEVLAIFEKAEAPEAYRDLHAAYLKAGGIERPSALLEKLQ